MNAHPIDLRSDTVTKPSEGMRRAMATAEVGDDVFGEDPTVNRLQRVVAEMLGKEAALFVPSGSMANQICIKVHTQPGDEIIAEEGSHVFNYEAAGAAFLSNVQVHTVKGTRGVMDLKSVLAAIRPALYYMPRTRLICLENTHNRAGGTVYPLVAIVEMNEFARQRGLRLHLDGARLWNASVATGLGPEVFARYFDSVSVCLSKGLGAPVGSVITGERGFIDEARHYRKLFGGGMRQAGILAAAGLYAIEHNIARLAEDHEKTRELARELSTVPGIALDMDSIHTNMLMIDVGPSGRNPGDMLERFAKGGVLLSSGNGTCLRAVTHLDVTFDEVRKAGAIICEVVSELT
jgi:threonine aldolase